MQIVNNTDEPITIEPGEAISVFKTTHRSWEGNVYRIDLDMGVDGPYDEDELEMPARKKETLGVGDAD